MNALLIRNGIPSDAGILADFNRRMAWETEHLELPLDVIGPGVEAALASPVKAQYFVAEIDRQIVGQLMITYEWSDWRNGNIWWIQSVYVHPDFRRRGIFRALYEHARNASRAVGAVGLRLYVERQNSSAQATYQSLGMHDANYLVMEEMFARSHQSG